MGFIALSAVAVVTGLVLIAAIRKRLDEGETLTTAIEHGTMERVRPVLMTDMAENSRDPRRSKSGEV